MTHWLLKPVGKYLQPVNLDLKSVNYGLVWIVLNFQVYHRLFYTDHNDPLNAQLKFFKYVSIIVIHQLFLRCSSSCSQDEHEVSVWLSISYPFLFLLLPLLIYQLTNAKNQTTFIIRFAYRKELILKSEVIFFIFFSWKYFVSLERGAERIKVFNR